MLLPITLRAQTTIDSTLSVAQGALDSAQEMSLTEHVDQLDTLLHPVDTTYNKFTNAVNDVIDTVQAIEQSVNTQINKINNIPNEIIPKPEDITKDVYNAPESVLNKSLNTKYHHWTISSMWAG